MVRYSVLTFIFGNYEIVKEVDVVDSDAEYILVTDNKDLRSDTWKVVFDEKLVGLSIIDKCYYVRYHPFEYVNSDICFRIDGSIQIKNPLSTIVDCFEENKSDIAIMINPVYSHLHEDYDYWIKNRNYPASSAAKCLQKLSEWGYDPDYLGYYQVCFTIERKNELTKEIDDRTYNYLLELGENGVIERFDQPIWSFVINKYFEDRIKVMPVSEYLITCSPYFDWCFHNTTQKIPFKVKTISAYLFNRRIETVNFDFLHNPGHIPVKITYLKRLYFDSITNFLHRVL